VDVAEQRLQPEEVPGRLRRVRGRVGVPEFAEGGVHERREDRERREDDHHRDELLDQQVRPHVAPVALFAFDALDALGRDEREQPVLLGRALLGFGDVAGGGGRLALGGGERRGGGPDGDRRGRDRSGGRDTGRNGSGGRRCGGRCRGAVAVRGGGSG